MLCNGHICVCVFPTSVEVLFTMGMIIIFAVYSDNWHTFDTNIFVHGKRRKVEIHKRREEGKEEVG